MAELQKLNLTPTPPVSTIPQAQPIIKPAPVKAAFNLFIPVVLLVTLVLGVISGWGAFKVLAKSQIGSTAVTLGTKIPAGNALKVGDTFGVPDEKTFKDSTEGVLEKGGLNGEGSHHLVRPGGKSQTVYLTSSVVDLDQVAGHRVKVWGETFAARKAGWLMDVGRVQILELNVPTPSDQ